MSELDGASYFTDHRRRKQSDAKLPTALAPEHQRGMRSFLTWSFLLAQIAAVEQMAGSAAASAATTDLPASPTINDAATVSTLPESSGEAVANTDKSADAPSDGASVKQVHDAVPPAMSPRLPTAPSLRTPPVSRRPRR